MSVSLRNGTARPDDRRVALSIIIPNWNTRELLQDLLASIERHRPPWDFEVIVVDNGSSDGSVPMVTKEFPWVRLLKNASNLGYARANNQGFASSRGDFILLLGSDTVIVDDSIESMCAYLHAHSDAGAVTCRLVNPDRSPQHSCRRFPTLANGIATYLSLHALSPRYNMRGFDFHRTQVVEQPAATCLLLRREVAGKTGLFDEHYTILYNDVDLCMRIRKNGWNIVYVADGEIVHHGSKSTSQATPEVRLEMYRNILLYYSRHAGRWSGVILRPILTVRLFLASRSLIAFRLMGRDPRKEIP